MSEESWHQARLIPTSGISGAEEQERRATSAFLAVLGSVKEYGRVLLSPLGAPAATANTFIETPFVLDGSRYYPDGLIRVTRGSKEWTALVEVKTGHNDLDRDQLLRYLAIAKQQGFDALITISNEITCSDNEHPTLSPADIPKGITVQHWSWSFLLAQAVLQKEHRGVDDPDQAWILGELIRYLEHPKSGALEFDSMGKDWVPVRDACANGTLRPTDRQAIEVVARFEALLRFVSLHLGRQLGTDVTVAMSRRDVADPNARRAALLDSLTTANELSGAIKIPGTPSNLHVTANLLAARITCHVDLNAPREGRSVTRVNWLLKQLAHAPDATRIETSFLHARGPGAAELLSVVREDPASIVLDQTREVKSFGVALTAPMGTKSSRGRNSFIDSVIDLADQFYGEVVQHLREWSPPARRDEPVEVTDEFSSTALSSQDGPSHEAEERQVVESPDEPEVVEEAPAPESVVEAPSETPQFEAPEPVSPVEVPVSQRVAEWLAPRRTTGETADWYFAEDVAAYVAHDLRAPVDARLLIEIEHAAGRQPRQYAGGEWAVQVHDDRFRTA